MILHNAPYLLTLIGLSILFALSTVRGNTKELHHFSRFTLAVIGWIGLQWLATIIGGYTGELIVKLSVAVSLIVIIALFNFIEVYTGLKYKNRIILALKKSPFIAVPLMFTPLGVIEVAITSQGIATDRVGMAYWVQILVTLALFILLVRSLIIYTKRVRGQRRTASQILIIALTTAFAGAMLSGTVFASSAQSQMVIPLTLLIMNFLIYYALAKHSLLDIRGFVARAVAYIATLGIIVLAYALFIAFSGKYIFNMDTSFLSVGLFASLGALTAILFQPTKEFFNKLTDTIFFRDSYDVQSFLDEFNKVLISNIDVRTLLRLSADVIERNLKCEWVLLIVPGNHEHGTRYIESYSSKGKIKKDAIDQLLKALSGSRIMVRDELQSVNTIYNKLLQADVSVASRLVFHEREHDKDSPTLLLGPKKSGNSYSAEDRRVIEIISDELVIAIQNALRFEEIQNFSVELQERINIATKRLRASNAKLKELDEAKDDFISMASHQLRTPLTSVKGYISMIKDGDGGKVTPQQKQMLEQAFFSSQRMVYLIADLLNVSRLRTGKFSIETHPVDLDKLINEEIEQLIEIAKSRKLTLKYDRPKAKDKPPLLMLDEIKIRQIIMNFVDNAIYYTPENGEIHIQLINKSHTVEVRVSDSGIGVPKSEQKHLFTKFYRASNARTTRPDGTGLGLFMAKKVIIAQHGTIIFESTTGKGSTFGFILSKSKLRVPE